MIFSLLFGEEINRRYYLPNNTKLKRNSNVFLLVKKKIFFYFLVSNRHINQEGYYLHPKFFKIIEYRRHLFNLTLKLVANQLFN